MAPDASGGPRQGLRRVVGVLAGLGVAAGIFFVTGEVLARAFGLVDRLNGYGRVLLAPGPGGDLPYVLRPGVNAQMLGVDVRVNALGLRGGDVGDPAPGTLRVLVLGDSVVFGWRVAEAETLAVRLQGELRSRGINAEVLSGGVFGYNLITEAALLARLGPVLRPAVVVVGMSLNDYDRVPRYHPTGVLARTGEVKDSWPNRSEFVLLLRWVVARVRGEQWQQQVERLAASPQSGAFQALDSAVAAEHRAFYRAPAPDAWARLRAGVRALRDESGGLGARLVIAILPESWQLPEAPDGGQPQERLLTLCTEERVTCVDLLPSFRAADRPLFLDTQHPNAAGHAVAARAVANELSGGGPGTRNAFPYAELDWVGRPGSG